MNKILHIDASARHTESTTRGASEKIVAALSNADTSICYRNAGAELPLLNEAMVQAYFTPADQRSDDQVAAITDSNAITQELIDADLIVIGVPMYNFAAPAAFKAWCDLAARVNVTFKYTESGPQGLLRNKRAIVVTNSGGTNIGGAQDFLTPWLKHFLGFIGIEDCSIVTVDQLAKDPTALIAQLDKAKALNAA